MALPPSRLCYETQLQFIGPSNIGRRHDRIISSQSHVNLRALPPVLLSVLRVGTRDLNYGAGSCADVAVGTAGDGEYLNVGGLRLQVLGSRDTATGTWAFPCVYLGTPNLKMPSPSCS